MVAQNQKLLYGSETWAPTKALQDKVTISVCSGLRTLEPSHGNRYAPARGMRAMMMMSDLDLLTAELIPVTRGNGKTRSRAVTERLRDPTQNQSFAFVD